MCDCCEHTQVIMENRKSRVFICAGRLCLQNVKPTGSRPASSAFSPDVPLHDTVWIHIQLCPVCGKVLAYRPFGICKYHRKNKILLKNDDSILFIANGKLILADNVPSHVPESERDIVKIPIQACPVCGVTCQS